MRSDEHLAVFLIYLPLSVVSTLCHRTENTTEQNNTFEVAPNFASIKSQIQAKIAIVLHLFHKIRTSVQAFKYLQIYFESTKYYW